MKQKQIWQKFLLIYKVLCYFNDFWNWFYDKVYLKNDFIQ